MLNLIDCNAFEKLRRDSSRTAALSRLSLKGDFAPLGACPRKGLSHLPCKNKKPRVGGILILAEKEGFEPSKDLRL